jgi:hypothetical protein
MNLSSTGTGFPVMDFRVGGYTARIAKIVVPVSLPVELFVKKI